jgi:hypothetical protein
LISTSNSPTTSSEDILDPFVEDPKVPDTQKELLEASKLLLTKLTLLTVGENGLDKIPNLLHQLFAGFGLEAPTTSPKPTTTTTISSTTLRTRNFKHNSLSNFYKQRLTTESSVEDIEDQRLGLLSSLRNQIIESALKDRKIVAKANHIPVYEPARKVGRKKVKVFYNQHGLNKDEDSSEQNIQLQQDLASELNNTLKSHLQNLLSTVQTQKKEKQDYEESVVSSVKEQLLKFTQMLNKKTEDTNVDKPTDSNIKRDLAMALETQLRSFYGDL